MSNFLNNLAFGNTDIKVGNFSINLPSLNISNPSIESVGLGGYIASAGSVTQTLTKGARGVFCIGALITNPEQALKALQLIQDYIVANALQLTNDIYKTCMARINNILSSIYGLSLGYFNSVQLLIKAVQNTAEILKKLYDDIIGKGKSTTNKLFERENCEFVVANMIRCMMAKILDPIISNTREFANQTINNIGDSLNDNIFDASSSATTLSYYFRQQASYIEKYNSQVKNIL